MLCYLMPFYLLCVGGLVIKVLERRLVSVLNGLRTGGCCSGVVMKVLEMGVV